jgi:hypothetical protein
VRIKSVIFLEGSQAFPAPPSDTSNAKVKTFEWLEVVPEAGAAGVGFSELMFNYHLQNEGCDCRRGIDWMNCIY